jgi:hypothetical protein
MNGIPYKKSDGSVHWFLNSKRHRTDGPAIECADGSTFWYLNGKHHREGGPAYEDVSGRKEWYVNGLLHREDGPAVEQNGYKAWYLNGEPHREDGPAIQHPDGRKAWFINGGSGYHNYEFATIKGNFIVLERGIPTDVMFGNLKLTNAKLLTATGTILVWDNLPGGEIGEDDG